MPNQAVVATSSDEEDDIFLPNPTLIAQSSMMANSLQSQTEAVMTPGGVGAGPVTPVGVVPMSTPLSVPIQTDPKKVVLNGYLMKLGSQRKTWRKRWFVLTSADLVYTKSHMVGRLAQSSYIAKNS